MTHACPVANCSAGVPANVYMCARHWRMVPRPLQQAVYESYRATGGLSDNHREAVRVVDQAEIGRTALALPAGTKALTLWQPWASLIMIGAKRHEFRRWNFTDKPHLARLVGQRIVVHAGARAMRAEELIDILERIDAGESALQPEIARPYIERLLAQSPKPNIDALAPRSAALGTCVIGQPQKSAELFKHIVADSDRLDQQMYAWPVSDVQPFAAPIPSAGAQGFWNWS